MQYQRAPDQSKLKNRYWYFSRQMRGFDKFAKPVPTFKINGESSVNTVAGGILSSIITLIVLSYSIGKLVDLHTRNNPIITDSMIPDYFGPFDDVEMGNFRVAISVRGYYDKQLKNDPKYIKWIARIRNFEQGGNEVETPVLLHQCTEEDLDKFYPLDSNSQEYYDDMKK